MPRLTVDQQNAVERRRGSLLLSAGAGSGKTSVLVERFVRAVHEDRIPPGRILAITFTDRAAAELRERVRARLRELGDRELARESERAPIGTIHAFCARVLRAHGVAAGLDPAFEVLDEARTADLREASFAVALRPFLGTAGPAGVDLLAAYGADGLQASILDVHDVLRTRGERAPRLPAVAGAPEGAIAALRRRLSAAAVAARDEIVAAGTSSAAAERALTALGRADALAAAAAGDGPALPAECAELSIPAANGALGGAACAAYREAVQAFTRACADRHAVAALRLLDTLLAGYGDAYAAAKRRRGAVDFDDLEIEAAALLAGNGDVRRAWSERFELLMIDEFQDTNPRQLGILRALERDNLFTVGDEFQSIYGFRHADVTLFRERRGSLAASGAALRLADNFRGRRELLEAVNAVFSPLFGDDFAPLVAGRDTPEDPAPRVELLVTDQRGWDDAAADPAGELPDAPRWRQAEARLLAQRIADLVADGTTPGDVAVLLRATGDVPVFARALEEHGVPALVSDAGGFWSAQEVIDCLAYLAALANPLDDVALYGVLAGPFAGVGSDALALLARARTGGGRAWDALTRLFGERRVEGEPELDALRDAFGPGDAAALSAFALFLARERRLAPRRPIGELLEHVGARCGYEARLLALPFGERRLANVRKLVRLAGAYERGEGGGLRGFVDHAERRRASGAREPDAPVADSDAGAVRLMTIHAAKGLEFDVVAVADLGRQGRGDVPNLLVDGSEVGLRLQTLDGSGSVGALDFDALRERRLVLEAEEERRILYVAMTRARERLLLSGAVNPERWPADRPGAPALAWLGPALADDLPGLLRPEAPEVLLHPPAAPAVTVRCLFNAPATLGTVLRAPTPGAGVVPPVAPAAAAAPPPPWEPAAGEAPAAATGALSYTALAEFDRCGYRFYLERVLGLPPDERVAASAGSGRTTEGMAGTVRGSLVHRLLETLDFRRAEAPPPELVLRVAAELGAAPSADEVQEIAALVAAVADTELGDRLASAPRVWREYPFAFSLGDDRPLMTGVVDLIAHEMGGSWLVVDYKSDRVGDADLQALTERAYGVQRRVYGLAALRGGALTVDVVHWYLQRPAEPVTVRFAADEADALAAGLSDRVALLRAGRFAVSDRPHRDLCLTCPGRGGLCLHPPSLTLRESPEDPIRRDGEPIVARSVDDPPGGTSVSGGSERP
jgi:ATP-dependent exoDNAse (exonuclease V) beta subunit